MRSSVDVDIDQKQDLALGVESTTSFCPGILPYAV